MTLSAAEIDTYGSLLAESKRELGAAPLARLETAIRAATDGPELQAPDPLQEPCTLFIPGLTGRAWWDPASIPAVSVLEGAAPVVRQELEQVLQRRRGFQHFDEGPEGFQPSDTNYGWNAFYFRWNCRNVPRNQALCPRSTTLLQSLPDLAQQAWFSALKPGTHLVAHSGPTNAVLTLHLGLFIPRGCEIRVGRETRTWQEGKCLVLDDSFEHEVWHRGQETRIILLLDVWHPELTAIERSFLNRATAAIEIAHERTGDASAVDRHKGALDGQVWWK
jgi:aspartate beta-hydroxylase